MEARFSLATWPPRGWALQGWAGVDAHPGLFWRDGCYGERAVQRRILRY
jgi:hypothetical protein